MNVASRFRGIVTVGPFLTIVSTFDATSFTGVFEGGDHTISHLTITGGDWLGLFGCLASGDEVRNLAVSACQTVF